MKATITTLLLLTPLLTAQPLLEGQLTLKLSSGSHHETHRYRLKDHQLRIDQPGDLIPSPPINLINLKTNTITLLRPHNGTARTFTATNESPAPANTPPGFPAMPQLPPGIGPQSTSTPP
ncbi:MAG: hypothetical protein AAGC74_05575, partial [Verrucomicrobiota bacterium]